jgi:hypothetical protein
MDTSVSRRSFLFRATLAVTACLACRSRHEGETVIVNGWILNTSDLAGL